VNGFMIGNFEVFEVVENAWGPDPKEFFRASDEELAELRPMLDQRLFGPGGEAMLVFRCYVVRTPRHTIMVDTCLGNHKPRPMERANMLLTPFLEDLRKLGIEAESVDYVFCTHMHFDHVGWNTRLDNGKWVPTFTNARYLFRQKEYDYWTSPPGQDFGKDVIADSVAPIVNAGLVDFVADEFAIDDDAWIEPLEGHTPGHAGLHIKSQETEAIFTGDMLHHPLQILQPKFEIYASVDKKLSTRTRQTFLENYSDTNVRVVPNHFTIAEGGHIASRGDKFSFQPAG